MGGTFNKQNITSNQSQLITFTPSDNLFYKYILYKDGNVIKSETKTGISNFYLNESGKYKIDIISNNNLLSANYIIDKESPVISLDQDNYVIFKGETPILNYKAYDNIDGDLTSKVTYNKNLDLGSNNIKLEVSDNAGNTSSKYININVKPPRSIMFILQFISFILLFLVFYSILNFIRLVRVSNRLEPFILKPVKNDNPSLFDNLYNNYHKLLNKIMNLFKNDSFFKKYAKKKEKYVLVSNLFENGEEVVAGKITFSLFFTIIYLISKTIIFQNLTLEDIIFPLIIGFYLLDIIYFIKLKFYKTKNENDFLSAIIVMNNAFKANRSIYQAIDSVSKEVKGPVGKEFSKMKLELSYGLGIEEVFQRFSKRINLKEANYLTSSISILNKTGGDIVSVFDSIETSLFNKKKLKLEKKALTSSSKILLYVLFIVPILFVLIISMISPGYFDPFIHTKIGLILLFIMIMCYILFIVCIRKILKVKI